MSCVYNTNVNCLFNCYHNYLLMDFLIIYSKPYVIYLIKVVICWKVIRIRSVTKRSFLLIMIYTLL